MSSAQESRDGHGKGLALAFLSVVVWSFTGLVIRHIETASEWQIVFYRSIGLTTSVAVFLAVRYGRRAVSTVVATGLHGVVGGICMGAGFIVYLLALLNTTVANVSFLASATPFFAALIGSIVLKERVPHRTQAAILVALIGVGLMVAEGFAVGSSYGNLLALASTLCSAGFAVALRGGRQVDMIPTICIGGGIGAICGALFAKDLSISSHDLALCLFSGAGISAVVNALYAVCARYVPAATLTLIFMAEVVLSPLWVWLVLSETPTVLAVLGGLVVLGAILVDGLAAGSQRVARAPNLQR